MVNPNSFEDSEKIGYEMSLVVWVRRGYKAVCSVAHCANAMIGSPGSTNLSTAQIDSKSLAMCPGCAVVIDQHTCAFPGWWTTLTLVR